MDRRSAGRSSATAFHGSRSSASSRISWRFGRLGCCGSFSCLAAALLLPALPALVIAQCRARLAGVTAVRITHVAGVLPRPPLSCGAPCRR